MATRPGLIALLLAASGCAQYRSYPLLSLEPPGKTAPLELSGVALLDDGHVVAVAEGVADVLYAPDPDTALRPGGLLDLLPLRDGRDSCAEDDNASARCDVRHFRAEVRLQAQPIDWLEREKGVRAPFDVEDLSAFGPNRVIGVTKYSSVGRRTGFRRDLMARSRRQTERLFVLERRGQTWVEQDLPEITRLRDSLSDWGRANCNDDLLVEGLAYDREGGDVYVGLSRCSGPALRVLRYPLVDAKMGLAATLSVLADGSSGAPLGPAEGLTGLSTQSGHIYAVSAWDSYGYDTEPAFGGRLWRVDGDRLTPLDLADIFHDRPSALAVLPSSNPESDAVEALVLFDNDAEAGSAWHPNATVLTTPTAAPHSGAWARLISVERMPDALPLGLNGFDLRWFARDHRLAQLAVSLAKNSEGEPGAWTRALGGRWQVEIGGSLGMWARTFLPRSAIGRNRQAVALTDYSGVPGLNFTRYRVRITVVPRDRERENPSVAELMEQARPAYTVRVPIGVTTPGAGVVLQGFQIDTAARAEEGICLAGLDLGASLLDSTTIQVQSTIIGGICNDFDNRGPTLRHGRTTSPEGGVSVVLDLAVIEGAAATETSTAMWDRALPAPKVAPEADRADAALKATTDRTARANLHCGRAEAAAFTALPRQEDAPPPDWQVLGSATSAGAGGAAGSLRGFAFALDPVGFDPGLARPHLTEAEALARNNYVYRYLARLFVTPNGTFVEGGLSHGIHRSGLMRDNARPSALYTRLDATTFATLPAAATPWDLVTPAGQDDPNLLPEDGFVRWAAPFPLTTEPACSPGF
ncbi:hypothetical protein LBMAG42_10960 [Deltaproteobacteria bacterium]|nr:hypothetical protein LBMAG42_10960 [Deltaproteobacteria bacterium]